MMGRARPDGCVDGHRRKLRPWQDRKTGLSAGSMARTGRKQAMTRANKSHLPQKPCVACGRPFTWRRKWARDWERVRYCSERCRRARDSRKEAD